MMATGVDRALTSTLYRLDWVWLTRIWFPMSYVFGCPLFLPLIPIIGVALTQPVPPAFPWVGVAPVLIAWIGVSYCLYREWIPGTVPYDVSWALIALAYTGTCSVAMLTSDALHAQVGYMLAWLLTSALAVFPLKQIVRRGRPFSTMHHGFPVASKRRHVFALHAVDDTHSSFPSGDAAGAAVAVMWFHSYWPVYDWRVAALLALVLGLARVWFGVHYCSDVVAGCTIGTTFATCLHSIWANVPRHHAPAIMCGLAIAAFPINYVRLRIKQSTSESLKARSL